MDFAVSDIENVKAVDLNSSHLEKREKSETSTPHRAPEDEVRLSSNVKHYRHTLSESEKYLEDLEKTDTLSKEEIKKFQEKVQDFQTNYQKVDDKIVYSLMTLPAFQNLNSKENTPKPAVEKELEELHRIEEELNSGEKMEEVLEEALEFLMKSLIS
jgi:predicted  nucleic acid-binding Zn-ribbon protein